MSSPREAVYDVLLQKQQRADSGKAKDAALDEWARYEAQNAAAAKAYNGGPYKGHKRVVES